MSRYWLACKTCPERAEVDSEDENAILTFIFQHRPHSLLITRILTEQLEEWEQTLATETEQFLREAK